MFPSLLCKQNYDKFNFDYICAFLAPYNDLSQFYKTKPGKDEEQLRSKTRNQYLPHFTSKNKSAHEAPVF